MVVMLSAFLFNLMCGLVPCDPQMGMPVINPNPLPEIGFRSGFVNKTDVEPKVIVAQGKVEGYHMKTINGRTIFAFEGIPYGEPPMGFNRWKPPLAKRSWKGTLQAKKPGSDCLQTSLPKMMRVYGHEDCLFLNIFTPDLPYKGNDQKYPVIFYIHGGSYIMGAGQEHGPAYMLDEDVILVTINYRLGVLGFMSTGDSALPGNYGLKDQALALKWVYDNIASFGGDPKNINLWGHSAGGTSVHIHMIANKTREYFQKGISISSSAFNHWGIQTQERARNWANKMARWFRCPTEDSKALVNCLQGVTSINLVAAQRQLFDWFPFPATMFSPTIELESPDAFLTESAEQAYRLGHVAKKPWISTVTSREGQTAVLVLELLFRLPSLRVHWRNILPYYLDFAYISEDPDKITSKVNKFYLKDKSPRDATLTEIADMLTDRYFSYGIHKGLQAHSEIAPTYSYYFSFSQGKHNLGNFYGHSSPEWGPGHAEDDYYYYNSSTQYAGYKQTDIDYKMSRIMINLMVNFVTVGEPLYTQDDGEDVRIWDPVTNSSDVRMLQLDMDIKMIPRPNMERLKFWDSLGLKDTVAWIPF